MREVADSLRLMREVFLDRAHWVLSGAQLRCDLGDYVKPHRRLTNVRPGTSVFRVVAPHPTARC